MSTLTIESAFVETDEGVSLHCLTSGRGPSLVFVPGWMTTAEFWEPQIRHFAAWYRVVAVDPRSQGDSTKCDDGNSTEQRARDLAALIDRLGLAPATVVAWSKGVTDLLSMVDQFGTASLRSVVFVDGPIVSPGHDPEVFNILVDQVKKMQRDRRTHSDELIRRLLKKPHGDDLFDRLAAAIRKTPTNTAIALQFDALSFDYRAALKALDRPAMFVGRGEKPGPHVDIFRAERPGDRVEIFSESGHVLFLDEPDRFNHLLEEFLGPPASAGVSERRP